MIPEQIIAELRARADATEVVGSVVQLERAGAQLRGPCPFHRETDPSFYVHPRKKVYRCHGCGAQGDLIHFVMQTQGVHFADAVRLLAQRYGVAIENGKPDSYDPAAMEAARAAHYKRQEEDAAAAAAEEERLQAKAAEKYRAMWERAKPADPQHPYLVRKGIPPGELRQFGDVLLVPAKDLGEGNRLMTLQRIWPDGRKKFAAGGRSLRTRTTIGQRAFRKDGVIYVVEGYATGAAIHMVTKLPVVVAFNTLNLTAVATYLRERYPAARIIIAADNDRWSADHSGPNPGVAAARAAAEAAKALVAIPDFRDPKLDGRGKGPTDFNDLFLLEGELAVRRWLDPARASQARTVDVPAQAVAPAPEPPPPPPSKGGVPAWQDGTFRVLGFDGDTYVYLPAEKGQAVFLGHGSHKKDQLQTIAPLSWWETHFGGKKGVDWDTARDALFRYAHRVGVFDAGRRRGRGVWPEGDGMVLHLGDRLLAPGAKGFIAPEVHKSPDDYIYERLGRLRGPDERFPMQTDDAREILDVFHGLRWREPASGYLLAGWTTLAPLCGALPWRPHVWIVGNRGLGKSTIVEHLVQPLLGGMGIYATGATTEAGVRQELQCDSRPVIFDEAEEDETAGKRIQGVLGLARSASSESHARVLKGTVGGEAMYFRVRSMFCLSSINGALHMEADKSRVSLLALRGRALRDQSPEEREVARQHWLALEPRISAITEVHGRRLMARTLRLLRSGVLLDSVRLFRRVAATILPDQRTADQYGTLYAGAWTLTSDEVPTESDAREMLQAEDLQPYQSDQQPEGVRALQAILQQRERVETSKGVRSFSVGQLIEACTGRVVRDLTFDDADAALRQIGIRVDSHKGELVLLVAYSSEWMRDRFANTIYQRGMGGFLRSLPGAEPWGDVRYAGFKAKSTLIPMWAVEGVGDP